jgi:hypothetical protein
MLISAIKRTPLALNDFLDWRAAKAARLASFPVNFKLMLEISNIPR